MFKKALRPSAILLALTLFVAPVSKMHADEPCSIVTGCDPVPPPGALPSIVAVILSVLGLS